MNILKIYGQQFCSYYDRFDYDVKEGVTGIIASYEGFCARSNGAGKTKLITAILFALYGEGNFKVLDDLISNKAKAEKNVDMYAGIIFEHNGITYDVVRGIKNSSSYLKIIQDGELYGGPKTSVAEKEQYIKSVLGMDYAMFSAASYAEQKQLTKIIKTDAKVYLNKSLNFGFLAHSITEFNKLCNASNKEVDAAFTTWKAKEDLWKSAKEATEKVVKELEGKRSVRAINADITKTEAILNEHRASLKSYIEVSKLGEHLETLKSNLEGYISSISKYEASIAQTDKNIDDKEKQIKVLETEKDYASQKLPTVSKYLESLKPSITEAKANVDKTIVRYNELMVDFKTLSNSLIASDVGSECAVCHQSVSAEYKESYNAEIDTKLNEVKQALAKCGLENKQYVSILDTLTAEENKTRGEVDTLTHQLNRCDASILTLRDSINNLKESRSLSADQKKQTEVLKENVESEYTSKLDEYALVTSQTEDQLAITIDNLEDELADLKKEHESVIRCSESVKFHKGLELTAHNAMEEAAIVYDNAKYTAASNLDSLSILKGVYESAFAKSSQLIEYYANEFYHQIEPDFSIRIYKDTTVKSEPIVIDFICDGSKRGYSVLSEGQIDVAAMAYRVGLAKTIMAMSDNKIDVIVLDEPFADLDEYNRELVKRALIQLQTEFKKILLISHTPDITDCDNIVEVIMDKEKKSYLKIR